jgi:hypothetical protein
MRGVAPTIGLLVGLICGGLAPPAYAITTGPEACVLKPADKTIASMDNYLTALRIETRKLALPWNWVQKRSGQTCSKRQPSLTFMDAKQAVLALPSTGKQVTYNLSEFSLGARARTLARAVIQALAGVGTATPVPLLDGSAPIQVGSMALRATSMPLQPIRKTAIVLRLGGAYVHQFGTGDHMGGPTLEAGVSLFAGRLSVSLVGAYGAGDERKLAGLTTRLNLTELLVMVRGGLKLNAWLLRGGLGVGWQHRMVQANSEGRRSEDVVAASEAGVGALDVELMWQVTSRWHLSVLVSGRTYFGGVAHQWLGTTLYDSGPWAVGGQLALGVRL